MIVRRKYITPKKETSVITAEWLFRYKDIKTGHEWTEGPYINKITQGGLNNQAALLIGEVPSGTAAMHLVIGSNAAAAQLNDDIANMGEVTRKAIAAKTRTGALARFRAFFQTDEANGDHQCIGIVARSTDIAGSGELLNRLVQPFSKTDNTVMTVEVKWNHQGVSA